MDTSHRKPGKLSDIKPQIDRSYSQNGFDDANWVKYTDAQKNPRSKSTVKLNENGRSRDEKVGGPRSWLSIVRIKGTLLSQITAGQTLSVLNINLII